MMEEQFSRQEMLLGASATEKLHQSRVAVFGVGGVGGYAVEALARSGIGALDVIDNDTVSLSNLNRQILATHSTVGFYKADIAKQRILDIYPDCKVTVHKCFFLPETAESFDFSEYDYVIDAIDTVKGKLEIVRRATMAGTPVISCMGAGNKTDATKFTVTDIYKTSVCPLARIMRYELRKMGIPSLKVVYSEEAPVKPENGGMRVPGSLAFVPSVAGLIAAGEVIKELIQ